jgi:hypothetical protein
MAHLITNHDPYHVHKSLGLLVLLHYAYRYYLVVAHGTAFPSSEGSGSSSPLLLLDVIAILLHGALSWSSLLLPLPGRRNFGRPMIWPEFRYHSILFATRHVSCTVLGLCGMWPSNSEDGMMLSSCLVRGLIVLGTSHAALMITSRHGDRDRRTTNSMPYPAYVTPGGVQQSVIKAAYATAQFGATVSCVLYDDPTLCFAPLLGIQMAPLLMTLVRKNKIGCGTYHACYASCLFLGYVAVYVRMMSYVRDDYHEASTTTTTTTTTTTIEEAWDGIYRTARALVLFGLPFSRIRRVHGVSALAFWSVVVPFATIVCPTAWRLALESSGSASAETATMLRGMLTRVVTTSAAITLARQAVTYAPLFGICTTSSSSCSHSSPVATSAPTSTKAKKGEGNIDDEDGDDDEGDTDSTSSSSLSD